MADLTTFKLVDAGTAPTPVAASASDTAEVGNGYNTFLYVDNGGGASTTVTITVPGNTTYGQPTPDPAIVVAAGAQAWIPLRREYADATNAGVGRCAIAASPTTSVNIAVVQVG